MSAMEVDDSYWYDPPAEVVAPDRSVHEAPTEEECYLWAILSDPSGLDLAEFAFHDQSAPDGCYRAYDHQYQWWRDDSPRQVDQCSRSVGKSEGVINRASAFPFNFPGEEEVLIAPEGTHLDALTDRLEARLQQTRLLKEMIVHGRAGITHRPFKVVFANGTRVFSRLPQRSGVGAKGIHPVLLEVDEAQDVSDRTWSELPEVVRWEIPGAMFRIHGVSKGVQGDGFWEKTQENSGYVVHRITRMHTPGWTPEKRAQQIKDYGGSTESPDFVRNVYGEHGNAMDRIFVLQQLMACCDTNEGSAYNAEEYRYFDITADSILARAEGDDRDRTDIDLSSDAQTVSMLSLLDLPTAHLQRYDIFWMGMDVGIVSDPSEILIAAEYTPKADERKSDQRADIAIPDVGMSRLKILGRVKLRQVPAPLQAQLIMHLIDFYRPRAFCLDKTGLGLPLLQELQKLAGKSRLFRIDLQGDAPEAPTEQEAASAKKALTVIKGYGFSEKVVVEIDEEAAAKLKPGVSPQETIEKAGIRRNTKDAATDELRQLVEGHRWLMPYEKDLINQMNGQTWRYSSEPVDAYGKRTRSYSVGVFHLLDAARMLALGRAQGPIEALMATEKKQEPVLAAFGG